MKNDRKNCKVRGLAPFFRNATVPVGLCWLAFLGGLVIANVGYIVVVEKGLVDGLIAIPAGGVFWIGAVINVVFNLIAYVGLSCLVSKIRRKRGSANAAAKVMAVLGCGVVFLLYIPLRVLISGHPFRSVWEILFLIEVLRAIWRRFAVEPVKCREKIGEYDSSLQSAGQVGGVGVNEFDSPKIHTRMFADYKGLFATLFGVIVLLMLAAYALLEVSSKVSVDSAHGMNDKIATISGEKETGLTFGNNEECVVAYISSAGPVEVKKYSECAREFSLPPLNSFLGVKFGEDYRKYRVLGDMCCEGDGDYIRVQVDQILDFKDYSIIVSYENRVVGVRAIATIKNSTVDAYVQNLIGILETKYKRNFRRTDPSCDDSWTMCFFSFAGRVLTSSNLLPMHERHRIRVDINRSQSADGIAQVYLVATDSRLSEEDLAVRDALSKAESKVLSQKSGDAL